MNSHVNYKQKCVNQYHNSNYVYTGEKPKGKILSVHDTSVLLDAMDLHGGEF